MSDWVTRPLSALADIRVSNVDKKSLPGEKPVLLCNYMDAYANDYIRSDIAFMEATASAAEIAKFKVNIGDVVVTKDSETPDDIGIPAVVTEQIDNLVCGYHLALLKTRQEFVDPVFLCKQIGSHEAARYFGQRAAGSTRYGLSNSALVNFPVSLPGLPAQKRIASILTGIDTAIEKTEALIAKYQQIKAGLMHDLFTRGVPPSGQLRPPRECAPELYQETAIGWIPKEWDVVRAEELCAVVVDCPHSTPNYENEGYPCIRTADMLPGELLLEQAYRVSDRAFFERTERLVPKSGDIIYSREGERLGIASPVGAEQICLGQRVMLLRPADKVAPQFLMWAMNMPNFYRQVVRGLGATTSPHINVGDIKRIFVPKPDLLEQQRIGEVIADAHQRVKTEESFREKLRKKKIGLMYDLLNDRVLVRAEEPEVVDG